MSAYKTVIGLEVHCQLKLESKLFSPAEYAFGGEPNSRVNLVDLGLPGVLPRLNEDALRVALRAAIALECEINHKTKFDRKNYFYPDLPKGYQISQFDQPYCLGGRVPLGDGRFGQLHHIHLEEDAGKNMHTDQGSLVDLNRAGVALIEIVGMPDLHTPTEAHDFLENLKQILQYAGVSDCDMEKGSLRCDANISIMPLEAEELGTKVEIKNLNSFRMVERALEYEQRRQHALLASGGEVHQHTRLWNDERSETKAMRSKESTQDYRFFPEPDLPPIVISEELIAELRASMPELPEARRQRYADLGGLSDYDLGVLTADRHLGEYFEALLQAGAAPKDASNWLMGEVSRVLNESHGRIEDFAIEAARLAELIKAQAEGKVNRLSAKKVFERMLAEDEDAGAAIKALGLEQISDAGELEAVVQAVIAANPKPVADYKGGKEKALHALKGLVMKETRGKANPNLVGEILLRLLS
ncbi:MAG: Asp-tRNA(Asn)/Glu-tRNA(Gln) amidotransferase subunit GatB [Planctomycetota bacterium]|jgi:aspartyl-tRNA(Asn)/glutamyl-tRNA(Gln) amidotransferase subunit B